MFEKLLTANELAELKSMLRELNNLQESCAIGSQEACDLANIQYRRILDWKKNKMSQKIKETNMDNSNNLSFSTNPLPVAPSCQRGRGEADEALLQAIQLLCEAYFAKPIPPEPLICVSTCSFSLAVCTQTKKGVFFGKAVNPAFLTYFFCRTMTGYLWHLL